MTTRFNSKSRTVQGVSGIQSGYEGLTSTDVVVPPNGIADIDRALYNLFENELKLQVSVGEETKKVPTIFAAGEKWAQVKKNAPIRDRTGALILPLTTIVRIDVQQSMSDDIAGRGSNQHTGEIVIKRVLSRSDRGLQNLLNRRLIFDQRNVPSTITTVPGQLRTERRLGLDMDDPTVKQGGLLSSDRTKNITEIIVVPTPQYVTLKYEVTFWTMYMEQMNNIIEGVVSAYLPQTRGYRIEAESGYYFYAYVTSDSFKSGGNESNSTGLERIIKNTLEIEVPGFILASQTPGAPVPVRRYMSNPTISFEVNLATAAAFEPDLVEEPFLGADDPTLPMGGKERRKDLRKTYPVSGRTRPDVVSERDPALISLKKGQKTAKWRRVTVLSAAGATSQQLLRVTSQNVATGELVLDTASLAGFTIVSIDD